MSLAVVLAAADEPWEVGVAQDLQRAPGLELVRRCVDVADVLAASATGPADVALLSPRLVGLDADVVRRLRAGSTLPVVLDGGDAETAVVAALGVAAVLPVDDLAALPRLVAEAGDLDVAVATGTGDRLGRVVTVWGPTGAPGRSTVALGVAAEAAALGVPTLLVDADVHGGAIAPMTAMLDEVSGVLAAARSANAGHLDATGLAEHARELDGGLRVLTGLPRADRWPALRPAAFEAVLEVARQDVGLVVIDVGFDLERDEDVLDASPRRASTALSSLTAADTVVAVGSADPLGLTRLTRGLHDLRDVVATAPSVVVNRYRSSLGWSEDDVAATLERFTGLRPAAFLPDDRAAVDRAWVHGRTLLECAPDSPLRGALARLARTLVVPSGPLR